MSTTAEPADAAVSQRIERFSDPCVMVIFGASGDLTRRKLMPALYRLALEGLLPQSFCIMGNSRQPLTDEAFRAEMRSSVEQFDAPVDAAVWR
jgi:glucose-6-phosphate 1-dehydrogenase